MSELGLTVPFHWSLLTFVFFYQNFVWTLSSNSDHLIMVSCDYELWSASSGELYCVEFQTLDLHYFIISQTSSYMYKPFMAGLFRQYFNNMSCSVISISISKINYVLMFTSVFSFAKIYTKEEKRNLLNTFS